MSYRKILVPLVGAANDKASLMAAVSLARRQGSHVEALFVRFDPVRSIPYGYTAGDMSGYASEYAIEAAIRAADEALRLARVAFEDVCQRESVEVLAKPGKRSTVTADFRVVQGMFSEEVERASRLSDIVVFGIVPGEEAREGAREGVEAALLGGARPVLLVPREVAGHFGSDVAVAFDGSATASHAVIAAMPLLTLAKSIHALEVTEATGAGEELSSLRAYLALHGLKPTEHVVDAGRRVIGQALADAVSAAHCDTLVLGGYGHGRFREFLVGGVTRHLLRHDTPFALLLTH